MLTTCALELLGTFVHVNSGSSKAVEVLSKVMSSAQVVMQSIDCEHASFFGGPGS